MCTLTLVKVPLVLQISGVFSQCFCESVRVSGFDVVGTLSYCDVYCGFE